MAEFNAQSDRFNHAKLFISLIIETLVLSPSAEGSKGRCLSAVATVINASASLTFRGEQKSWVDQMCLFLNFFTCHPLNG